MKININTIIFLISLIVIVTGCKEKQADSPLLTQEENKYEDAHKHFPSEDGNIWIYLNTELNHNGDTTVSYTTKAVYDTADKKMIFYKDGTFLNYANWYNKNHTLYCCSNTILVRYDLLECDSDSILIDSTSNSNAGLTTKTYQLCDRKYAADINNYSDIPCIKTTQVNSYDDGSKLIIHRYFGYNIGLVKSVQLTYSLGSLHSTQILELKSHQFDE
ncbi:MAG: hypothetical protein COA58_01340 [Bacteroidetes bacterium]|nr:MAG: hypothetical protein COA58_01340 [Bacteroidota bacterium]